jgi:beta-lysine 5,6-aminomutase beta subunit
MPDADSGQVVRAYGDTPGDGMVQLSFTLPVPCGPLARAAGQQFARQLGLDPAMVVHERGIGTAHTFFVVYGRTSVGVDLSTLRVEQREFPLLSDKEIERRVREGLGRKLIVLGATIGTDAHTVGIDAILSVKGYAGEKGLEHLRELRIVNLGSQVPVERLVERAREEHADAVLVSQVVTQRDAHLHNARALSQAVRAAFDGRRPPLLVVGGPRFEPRMATDLGVDRVFGRGTTPSEVASYLVHALVPGPRAGAAR